jgi:sulfur-carrier protein
VADIRIPPTLPPLFPGLPRRLESSAGTVAELLETLDGQWPGFRDRLCEPGPKLRRHIHVYVDGTRAELESSIPEGARVDVITAISGG